MRTKNPKQPKPEDQDQDDSAEGVEVTAGGPAIAAAKKGKIAVIAASSILVTLVIYFLYFKDDSSKQEKLEPVVPPPAQIAASDSGKSSPFALENIEQKPKDDVEILEKPAVPEVPTLPELPKDSTVPDQINLAPQKDATKDEKLPVILLPTQITDPNSGPNAKQIPKVEIPTEQMTQEAKNLDPRYAPIIVMSGGAAGPGLGVGYENNIIKLNEDPIDQLKKSETVVKTTYIADRTHTIAQGKLLTAVLETAINTEIPGFVRAVVSRDVYGESGSEILIPKGSRLFGSYSSQVTRGQGRVEIGWTRLIRSDGVDLAITFNASDQFGRSGIPGEVDNKFGSVITNSLLTSILAVGGVALAQKLMTNNNETTTTTNPQQGTTTTTGSAANQAIYDVSKTITDTVGQIIGNTLDLKPVIRVPQGTKITVIVNSDIKVPSLSKR